MDDIKKLTSDLVMNAKHTERLTETLILINQNEKYKKEIEFLKSELSRMKNEINEASFAPEGALSIADNYGGELSIVENTDDR